MGTVTWVAPIAPSLGISSQSIGAGAGYKGSEYDNETNLYRWGTFVLDCDLASTPEGTFLLYLILDPTHASYEDGDASTQPAKLPNYIFRVRSVGTAQTIVSDPILLPPFAFQVLIWNDTDETSSSTSVTAEFYNETVA